MDSDFTLIYSGSICLLTPISKAAEDWVDAHLDPEARWLGRGVVVEHRYIEDIVRGIVEYGLTIN